eukprot:gene5739-1024_t
MGVSRMSLLMWVAGSVTAGSLVQPASASLASEPLSWNISKTYEALYLAFAAFCSNSSLMAWDSGCRWSTKLPGLKVQVVLFSSTTGARAYVGHYGSTVVVSFRGSDDPENDIHDITYYQSDYPGELTRVKGARVHHGFYQSFLSLWPGIQEAARSILSSECPACTR